MALPRWFLLCLFLSSPVRSMCPERCNCDDVNLVVTCIKAGLEVMPNTLNPRLKTIVYKYNNFPTVDVSLRFLSQLVKVDLSHNQIVSVTNRAFARLSELKQLNLDGNKISQVSNKTFFGLNSAQIITLRSNEVAELPDNLFSYAPKLEKLDFGRNRLTSVSATAFHGLKDLRILHLEDNYLTSVPSDAFGPIKGLAELHLSGNPLKTLHANAFNHFASLTILDLKSCRLSSIDPHAFRGLGSLRQLRLADNNLTTIPTDSLRLLGSLHYLTLGRNPVQMVGRNALSPLTALKRFDLSGCGHLHTIESGAFAGSTSLQHVTVTLNRNLKNLAEDAFDPSLTTLHHLSLADNGLSHLFSGLLPWRLLKSLDLSGNPWQCDCDLSWTSDVLNHLSKNHSSTTKAGHCIGPLDLKGVSLKNLKACEQEEAAVVGSEEQLEDALIRRHEASNATAVIVSVSIVVTVVVIAVGLLLILRFKDRMQDCYKEYKWKRHDAALARKTHEHLQQHQQSVYSSPIVLRQDTNTQSGSPATTYLYRASPNFSYVTTYSRQMQPPDSLTHSYNYHHNSNSTSTQEEGEEEEYFYVTTQSAIRDAAQCATMSGKHIPVTVL